MVPKVVSLPVRLGLGATRASLNLTLKLTGRVAGEVLHVVGSRVGATHSKSSSAPSGPKPSPAQRTAPPAAPASSPSQGPVTTTAAPGGRGGPSSNGAGATVAEPTTPPPPAPAEPAIPAVTDAEIVAPDDLPDTPLTEAEAAAKTIDDEDEIVAEFAEPGAEDGAGAQIELPEPWEGYAEANASAIVNRINSSDAAAVAVVELYETAHKQRKTVLEAAERRLRELNPPGGN